MTGDRVDLIERRLACLDDVEPPDTWKRVVSMSPAGAEATASNGGWLVAAAVVAILALAVALVALLEPGQSTQRVETPPAGAPDRPPPAEPPERDAAAASTRFDPPPIAPRMGAAVVWTGTELVVWGGYDLAACCGAPGLADEWSHADGAALDPATGRWRSIDPAPLGPSFRPSHAVWTPDGLVVARGTSLALLRSDGSWQSLPEAPGVVGDLAAVASTVVSVSAGGALDLGASAWRPLPDPPVDLPWPQTVRMGDEVVAVGMASRITAIGYDPAQDSWRTLAPLPSGVSWHTFRIGSDADRLTVVTGRGHAVVFDAATGSWTGTEQVPGEISEWFEMPVVVAAGTTVVAMADRLAVRSADGAWGGVADRSRPVPFGSDESAVRWVELVSGSGATAFAVSIDPIRNENEVVALDLDVLASPAVELSLVAVSPNQRRIVNIDLSAARVSELAHLDSMSPLSGATTTSQGDVVVWGPPAYVFRDADLGSEPVELHPTRLHAVPGVADAVFLVPSPDGRQVWMVQPAMDVSLLDLVDVASGEVILHLELEPRAFPVDAATSGLVVRTDPLDRNEAGWVDAPERRRTFEVAVDGSITDLDAVWTLAANERYLVLAADPSGAPAALEVIDRETGSVARFDPPRSGRWVLLGGPVIPSHTQPLRTLATDGRVIAAVVDSHNRDGYPAATTLVVLSPADGTTRELARFESRPPLAAWSRDDRHIVVVDGDEVLVVDPDSTSSTPRRVATVPDGTWVLGAG